MAVWYLSVSNGSGSGYYDPLSYVNISSNSGGCYYHDYWNGSNVSFIGDTNSPSITVRLIAPNPSATSHAGTYQGSLSYDAGTGGYISGDTYQTGDCGSSGSSVTAIAYDGYVFSNWTGGSTIATRQDTFSSGGAGWTASFTPTIGYYNWSSASFASLQTLSAITVSAWIKSESDSPDIGAILGNYAYNTSGWYFGTDTTSLTFGAKWSTTLGAWSAVTSYAKNTWYHVAATYTKGATNTPTFYSNGVAKTTSGTTPGGGETYPDDSSNTLGMGRRPTSGTEYAYIDGLIRDPRIYNRILTVAEIYEIYKSRNITNNIPGLVFAPMMYGARGKSSIHGVNLGSTNYIIDPISKTTGSPGASIAGSGEIILHKG